MSFSHPVNPGELRLFRDEFRAQVAEAAVLFQKETAEAVFATGEAAISHISSLIERAADA